MPFGSRASLVGRKEVVIVYAESLKSTFLE
jgi:hypothetical protein